MPEKDPEETFNIFMVDYIKKPDFKFKCHPFKKKIDPKRVEREQFFKECLEQGKTHQQIKSEGTSRGLFLPGNDFHQKLHFYEDKFGLKAVYFISEVKREANRRNGENRREANRRKKREA